MKLTLGSKFEHNDYTGFEVQPGARLAWTPNERHMVWASVARAVCTPSRAQEDIRLNIGVMPGAPPTAIAIIGNDSTRSESLIAYELGYRVRPVERLSLDATAFYNDYDDLSTFEQGTPFMETSPAHAHAILPLYFQNKAHGPTFGGEVVSSIQFHDRWSLRLGYTFLDSDLKLKSGSTDDDPTRGPNPSHRVAFTIQSEPGLGAISKITLPLAERGAQQMTAGDRPHSEVEVPDAFAFA